MRNMSNVYRFTKTDNLEQLAKRKRAEIHRLEIGFMSYWEKKKLESLRYHLLQIQAELNARADQTTYM